MTKEMAKQVIDSLPDDSGLDEIIHALYVVAKFERGERQIRQGKGISHERVRQSLKKSPRACI